MKHNYLYILLLFFISINLSGQNEDWDPTEGVFDSDIKTVLFHPIGAELSPPMVPLGGGGLQLRFDDIDDTGKDFVYTVTLCNADWTPAELNPLEYLQGFDEGQLNNYEFSSNTDVAYAHYAITMPNQDIRWTKSGNYLLRVYEDEGDRKLVITRRFMVVENRMRVNAQFVPPATVSKNQTHQELDFIVNHKGIEIQNPLVEVKATILQNGNWDSAITGVPPRFSRKEEMDFNYQNKFLFPALKEFRVFSTEYLRARGFNVEDITYSDENGWDVYLEPDEDREFRNYSYILDINGQRVIRNFENPNRAVNRVAPFNITRDSTQDLGTSANPTADVNQSIDEARQYIQESQAREWVEIDHLEGDYAYVHFYLESSTELEKPVYVYGALTGWKLDPAFEMKYQRGRGVYDAQVMLKQGYYNYLFATPDDKDKSKPNFSEFEGNWYATENEYTILVYYRPFGSRYDRIMASLTLSSLRR